MRHLGQNEVLEVANARLGRLTITHRALWGRMSAHEMVCHLSDSFRLALGRKTASDATGVLQRTLMKWFALYVPLQWPKGIGTRPEMAQGLGGTRPSEFERDRSELRNLIADFVSHESFNVGHPIFGRMTSGQWLRWGYLHVDHHFRQFGV